MKPFSRIPPGNAKSRYPSVKPSHGQMARSADGLSSAAPYWLIARYETPSVTTRPSHHGCSAAHCTTSWTSSPSWSDNNRPTPSDRPQPRRSALTTVNPSATHHTEPGGWFGDSHRWTGDAPQAPECVPEGPGPPPRAIEPLNRRLSHRFPPYSRFA